MKLIRQKHKNGCVPACAAILAEVSYTEALSYFNDRDWSHQGTGLHEIVEAIENMGLNCKLKKGRVKSFSHLKTNSLLIVGTEMGSHAIVWDASKKKILDPYPAKNRILKKKYPIKIYEQHLIAVFEIK